MHKSREKSCGAVVFRTHNSERLYLVIRYAIEADYWGLPKGHVEIGESEEETARREINEEVGITDLNFIPGFKTMITYSPRPNVIKDVYFYLAETSQKKLVFISKEHDKGDWLPYPDALSRLKYPDDKTVLTKAEDFLKKNYQKWH